MGRLPFFFLFSLSLSLSSHGEMVRLKDLITIKGVRENPLVGHGLVMGLNGTGDGGGEILETSLKRMFQKFGFGAKGDLSSKNVASVLVTAKLPPFARVGQKIDVTVSSVGEASSLAGGTLLVTPLKGGDGKIYAVAHGPLSLGGKLKGGFSTTGKILGGGVVERELDLRFNRKRFLRLSLKDPDFTTSARIEKVINEELGGIYAMAKDASTLDLMIPGNYQRKVVRLMAIVENFKVYKDQRAKIIINERTGTVVAGGDVKLNPVAIGHGTLTIEVGSSIHFVDKKATLKSLVQGLNTFGVSPKDLISIFQALKSNGALVGDIELI